MGIPILVKICLIIILAPSAAWTLGEGADPRALDEVNAEINRLHAAYERDSAEIVTLECLDAAYGERIHLLRGADPEALIMVEKLSALLLTRDPTNLRGLSNRAEGLFARGQFDAARKDIETALAKHPNDGRGNLIRAKLMILFAEFGEAVRAASIAVASCDARTSAAALETLNKSRALSGKAAKLKAAAEAAPANPDLKIEQARLLLSPELAARPENARKAFADVETLVKRRPEYTEGQIFMAEVALKQFGEPVKAEKLAREALKTARHPDLTKQASKIFNEAVMKKAQDAQKKGR